MLRVDFITLFPEMILQAVGHSMIKRAREAELVEIRVVNPRDFATDKHHTVDDKPFGGGPGMLMMAPPIDAALISLSLPPDVTVLMPDPTGRALKQGDIEHWSQQGHVVILCGHYEGIDDRIRQKWNAEPISIGDYVLTGGELPALVMADAIIRTLPGVLGCADSLEIDSHAEGLLSAPQFTRPEVWDDRPIPDVLKSGDHVARERWKRKIALQITRDRRPDLFAQARLAKGDSDLLSS